MSSSTRAPSLGPQKPGISPANRSLERGIEILRSFRPGSEYLGNAEIAERTGLSRSTVSRLTQTLVGSGYLALEPGTRAYRLAPAVLSLAHAMRTGSTALSIAAPHMRDLAQRERVNVGLAAPDRDEMVYLESIRYNRRASLRQVVSGQRVPIELTSLGRAYLAVAPPVRRKALIDHFRRTRRTQWAQLEPALMAAIRDVEEKGFCAAAWQHEVVAVATPVTFNGTPFALNVSVSTADALPGVVRELAPALLALRAHIQKGLDAAVGAW